MYPAFLYTMANFRTAHRTRYEVFVLHNRERRLFAAMFSCRLVEPAI